MRLAVPYIALAIVVLGCRPSSDEESVVVDGIEEAKWSSLIRELGDRSMRDDVVGRLAEEGDISLLFHALQRVSQAGGHEWASEGSDDDLTQFSRALFPSAILRAANTLAKLDSEGRIDRANLALALRDPSEEVRTFAALVRGIMEPTANDRVQDLEESLNDESADVRLLAAYALAKGGQGNLVTPLLIEFVKNPDVDVRRFALSTLKVSAANDSRAIEETSFEKLGRFPWEGDGIVLVIDRRGRTIEFFSAMKLWLQENISALPSEAYFGMVFSSYGPKYPRDDHPTPATDREKAVAADLLETTRLGRSGGLVSAFLSGLLFVDNSPARKNAILYVGHPSKGYSSFTSVVEEVTKKNAGRAEIHVLGVRRDPRGVQSVDEFLLRYLAEANRGSYRRVVYRGASRQ